MLEVRVHQAHHVLPDKTLLLDRQLTDTTRQPSHHEVQQLDEVLLACPELVDSLV
jgi:hypothetical protein